MVSYNEAANPKHLASLASLAEKKFSPSGYSDRNDKVTLQIEVAQPALFSIFCVLSG